MGASPVSNTALWSWLQKAAAGHAAKLADLRGAIEPVLGHISRIFPHYPDHAVGHSDEIISQVSNLLFDQDSPSTPVVPLSPAEALIIAAAAYLHDVGMIVPERERFAILSKDEWKTWINSRPDLTGSAYETYALAEFIRVGHASRSATILLEPHSELANLLPDDTGFRKSVADVCKSHARQATDLRNRQEYSDQVDILGDKVNVAFCCSILRLADLLDVRESRASRLLWKLAIPVPDSSRPHWEAFRRIEKRNVTSRVIEMTAVCASPDEHRVLRNWFQWIADETANAARMSFYWRRHKGWAPPHATIGERDSTLVLSQHPAARFKAVDWKFRVDDTRIIQGFIASAGSDQRRLVRELLKNALDATRARLEEDDATTGDASRLAAYAVSLCLSDNGTLLTIEDHGIGMDESTVEHYFLQLGKSYYRGSGRYRFYASSQHGIGFLTVFAHSSDVVVETRTWDDSPGMRIQLQSPDSFFIVEETPPGRRGTTVSIRLRNPWTKGQLASITKSLVRHLEVPINVEDHGDKFVIAPVRWPDAPTSHDFETFDSRSFRFRTWPIVGQGLHGRIVLIAEQTDQGENWAPTLDTWQDVMEQETEERIEYGRSTTDCGLATEGGVGWGGGCDWMQLDVRREGLGTRNFNGDFTLAAKPLELPEVRDTWTAILEEHLSSSAKQHDLTYLHRLAAVFDLPTFWDRKPLLDIHRAGHPQRVSVDGLMVTGGALWVAAHEASPNEPWASLEQWHLWGAPIRGRLRRSARLLVDNVAGQPALRISWHAKSPQAASFLHDVRSLHSAPINLQEVDRGARVPPEIAGCVSATLPWPIQAPTIYCFADVPLFSWLLGRKKMGLDRIEGEICRALIDENYDTSTLDSLLKREGCEHLIPVRQWFRFQRAAF